MGIAESAEEPEEVAEAPESQAVKLPVLCQRLVNRRNDVTYSVEMSAILDESLEKFAITSSGTQVEVTVAEGRMLSLNADGKDITELYVRNSRGDTAILTIMDERGAYVGKVAQGLDGNDRMGLIFSYMQKPCAKISADNFSSLSIRILAMQEEAKDVVMASTSRKGNSLCIQVSKGYDGCILLGILLGLLVLEPVLLQCGAG